MKLCELINFLKTEDPRAATALERVAGFERDEWVLVYRWDLEAGQGDSVYPTFLRGDELVRARHSAGHDQSPGSGRPGFVTDYDGEGGSETRWTLVGEEDAVPLVHVRHFDGPFPSTVELAEDFRLCFDLYEDLARREFVTVDELGDRVVAARWDGADLLVSKRFLRRYQAARQLHLALQFCVDRNGGTELRHLDAVDHNVDEDTWHISYHGANGRLIGPNPFFTRLVGKRILPPPAIERAGISPYDEPEEYESFIIGLDEEGRPATHSCDPDQLANNFSKKPDAPHYLTPVFFRPEVLDKYHANPDRYSVEDGHLNAGAAFGLRMDNGRRDQVVVFLGDLGRDLPHREQQYWRSFNINPTDGMSEVAIRRSFLGEWADSNRPEHRLQVSLDELKKAWTARFGWTLYDDLHEHDAHLGSAIRIPTNPTVSQFDDEVAGLAKLVVGYLNERGIEAASDGKSDSGGINKLDLLLAEQRLPAGLCDVLRRVQGARTRSASHRKSTTFDLDALLDGRPDLPSLFASYLDDLADAFVELATAISPAGEAEPVDL